MTAHTLADSPSPVCDHRLGGLPCINHQPHEGGDRGRGCVHTASAGSHVDDRHRDGGHG